MSRPALHGALLLLVVLAGCTGYFDDPPERDERAVTAVEDAREALDAVSSYRYEHDLHVEATGDRGTERIDVRATGAVNATTKRMNATVEGAGETRESYLLNRTSYQKCTELGDVWGVRNHSTEHWRTLTPAYRQLSLLESGALHWEGSATIDGRNVTVVVGEPTVAALQQYSEDRSRPLFGGPEIHDVAMNVWLDTETGLPLRTTLRFSVGAGDSSGTARIETWYGRYGEPVTIHLPEEARDPFFSSGCPGS